MSQELTGMAYRQGNINYDGDDAREQYEKLNSY
jgi:hypothetical protein